MPNPAATPIAVAVTRKIDSAHRQEAEQWVRTGQRLVESFPGFLGSGWIRSEQSPSQWLMVFRFSNSASLAEWHNSADRSAWVSRGEHFVEQAATTHVEGWFDEFFSDGEPRSKSSPPRWKQMIAIFLVFFPLSLAANYALAPTATFLPLWLRVLIAVAGLTPVMTYWALPFINRALKPWLSASDSSPGN